MATMPKTIDIEITTSVAIPHLDQYFGPWAMLETRLLPMVEHVRTMDIGAHIATYQVQAVAEARSAEIVEARDDTQIQVIRLNGPLMKHVSSLSGGTSTARARQEIRAAARNGGISGILLVIDSPGGTVAGTQDLANEVAEAAKVKPVFAFIEDLGASAAYWIASQATKVYATETALVGSIGTFTVIHDMSDAASDAGIKVHVIHAGEFKGAFAPGTAITEEQLAEVQRVIDGLNEFFVKGVAAGRSMSISAVRKIADGRIHIAAEAHKLGLIDGVQTFQETLTGLVAATSPKHSAQSKGEIPMSTETVESTALEVCESSTVATYAGIVAECEGAGSDFICEQLKASATVEQARQAWSAAQNTRIVELEKRAKDKANAPPEKSKHGVDPVEDGAGEDAATGSACGDFEAAVAEKVKRGMSRARATSATVREDPERHTQYLVDYNEQHKIAAR